MTGPLLTVNNLVTLQMLYSGDVPDPVTCPAGDCSILALFPAVGPSPRIQWAFASGDATWHELRPRPRVVSATSMLRRLFWNADWNDKLFMVSCAERILDNPTPHSIEAIRQAVGQEICRQSGPNRADGAIQTDLRAS